MRQVRRPSRLPGRPSATGRRESFLGRGLWLRRGLGLTCLRCLLFDHALGATPFLGEPGQQREKRDHAVEGEGPGKVRRRLVQFLLRLRRGYDDEKVGQRPGGIEGRRAEKDDAADQHHDIRRFSDSEGVRSGPDHQGAGQGAQTARCQQGLERPAHAGRQFRRRQALRLGELVCQRPLPDRGPDQRSGGDCGGFGGRHGLGGCGFPWNRSVVASKQVYQVRLPTTPSTLIATAFWTWSSAWLVSGPNTPSARSGASKGTLPRTDGGRIRISLVVFGHVVGSSSGCEWR